MKLPKKSEVKAALLREELLRRGGRRDGVISLGPFGAVID
jgi:hypothetical protein